MARKNENDLDFGRILASAVEAALGDENGQGDSGGPDNRGRGGHAMRNGGAGVGVAAAARVAYSKTPTLVKKAVPRVLGLPKLSDVSDKFTDMTDRVRDGLADHGWLGDDEPEDEEAGVPEDEEEDLPEDEEEDLPEDELDDEPEDEEEDLPEDEEEDLPEYEEEDLPEDELEDEPEDEEEEDLPEDEEEDLPED